MADLYKRGRQYNHDQPHIRRVSEEKRESKNRKCRPPRHRVFERRCAGLSRCRAILVRCVKLLSVYLSLLNLAHILSWYRRLYRLKRF